MPFLSQEARRLLFAQSAIIKAVPETTAGATKNHNFARATSALEITKSRSATGILELKMCSAGYSSTYAAAGESQLLHYMENRQSHLGYLIVFDARARDFGRPLLNGMAADTVINKFVNLVPSVREHRG